MCLSICRCPKKGAIIRSGQLFRMWLCFNAVYHVGWAHQTEACPWPRESWMVCVKCRGACAFHRGMGAWGLPRQSRGGLEGRRCLFNTCVILCYQVRKIKIRKGRWMNYCFSLFFSEINMPSFHAFTTVPHFSFWLFSQTFFPPKSCFFSSGLCHSVLSSWVPSEKRG